MTTQTPILCAVDFSDDSEAALLWAAAQAEREGAPLVVLHVVHDPAASPGTYSEPGAERVRPIDEVGEELFAKFLDGVLNRNPEAPGLGRIEETRLETGLPSGRICEVADEIGARLVVVGSRGRTGLPHVMLGSVAERVAQMAAAPVTVVKNREGETT